MTTHNSVSTITGSQRATAGLVLLVLGAAMLFAVGLSQMAAAHNAAHDTRHSIGFPCH